MTNEEAREAWKKLYSEIDKDNWLFVGTINPEMVALAIKALEERPQGEITNEDIQQAIKEGFTNGYEMAKAKIIHSIAEQYSEHNELVPIWLSIGDMKGGAEDEL